MKAKATPAPALPAQPYEDNLPLGPAFAAVLREEREQLGLSLYAFARAARVSRSMLYYIERGQRRPTLDMVARLCRAIGKDWLEVLARARQR